VSVKVTGQKEDITLPTGTVIGQHPLPGQKIKLNQSIHVIISQRPAPVKAPLLTGLTVLEIKHLLEGSGLRCKVAYLESEQPEGRCFAQFPASGMDVLEVLIIAYISLGTSSLRLCPDFKGYQVSEIKEFLKPYDITLQEFDGAVQSTRGGVIDSQNPPPGSFLDLKKRPRLYVRAV
jgi:eukaryotic-like serine/threonine-protein kinase